MNICGTKIVYVFVQNNVEEEGLFVYFTNPIVIFGLVSLALGLLLTLGRAMTKPLGMRQALGAATTTCVLVGVVWSLLGAGMGMGHQSAHTACQTKLAAGKQGDQLQGCQTFFDLYGPYPPGQQH